MTDVPRQGPTAARGEVKASKHSMGTAGKSEFNPPKDAPAVPVPAPAAPAEPTAPAAPSKKKRRKGVLDRLDEALFGSDDDDDDETEDDEADDDADDEEDDDE